MNDKLTHIDSNGKASMVNIEDKKIIRRTAKAEGKILLSENTINLIKENNIKKGDVLSVSKIAGIMGAKQTSSLIPLCHNINIDKVDISFNLYSNYILVKSEAICNYKTGIEMEALTGLNIALLTIWDMCKAVDKNMKITDITLTEKIKEY